MLFHNIAVSSSFWSNKNILGEHDSCSQPHAHITKSRSTSQHLKSILVNWDHACNNCQFLIVLSSNHSTSPHYHFVFPNIQQLL